MTVRTGQGRSRPSPGLGDDALEMFLDATDPSSWAGTGPTWIDLTGHGHSLPVGGSGEPVFATTGLGITGGSGAAWSIATWVRFSTLEGWQTIVGIGDRNENALYFQKANPDIGTETTQVYGTSRGPNLLGLALERTASERLFCFHQVPAQVGAWYHLVMTADTSTVTLYVNGSVSQSVTGLGGTPYRTGLAPATGAITSTVGDRSDNIGDPLGGALAFLPVWSRSTTASEVADQDAATKPPYHGG